ncbi:hypothetical protein R3P38DRAFT_2524007, partial [Favolaschia claudopus]
QTAQEVASFRFGCRIPNVKVRPAGLELPNDKLTCKVMGDKDIQLPCDAQTHNLKSFLSLAKTVETFKAIDSALLDFHYPPSAINQVWAADVKRVLCRERLGFAGGLLFIVHDTDAPGPLYMVLDSATTVLEIERRQWGPSISDIALRLLHRGIPFHLCVVSHQLQPSSPPPKVLESLNPYSGMGYRLKDFQPDMRDYNGYLDCREHFLRTSRGQVALRSGGIIARIAREVLTIEDGLLGPGDEVTRNGICFWDGHTPGALWDDQLTEDEIDIVCGVYHIATGQRDPNQPRGRQITTRSWWPRPSAFFRNSALAIGWWTPACESFYARRVTMYKEGTLKLETAAAWKENLKLDRKVLPYINAIESHSSEILAVLRP